MRPKYNLLLLTAISLLLSQACNHKEEIEPLNCQLQAFGAAISGSNIQLVYSIEGEGRFSVEFWTYSSPDGELKKVSPAVPQSDTLQFFGEAIPKTTAKVSVTDGWVRIRYTAAVGDNIFSGSDKCEQKINP